MKPTLLFSWIRQINIYLLICCVGIMPSLSLAEDSRGLRIKGELPVQANLQHLSELKNTYRALIIGNNDYRDPSALWKPLKRAVSDARAMEELLVTHYGFTDVQRLENASRRQLLHALRDLTKRVNAEDNVLIYYAGHGFLDEYTNKGYWVPVDAEGIDHATFVRNSTIRDELSVLSDKAKHTLLISDSCFSGTLLKRGNRGIKAYERTPDYFKAVNNKKSVQIITAGGVEYVDDDYRSSGHSPFTYFLKSELENNPKAILTTTELSEKIQLAVSNNVEQKPQAGVLQGAGDELGEFLFIKVNLDVSGIPKERVKVKVNVVSDTASDPQQSSSKAIVSTNQPEREEEANTEKEKSIMILPMQTF